MPTALKKALRKISLNKHNNDSKGSSIVATSDKDSVASLPAANGITASPSGSIKRKSQSFPVQGTESPRNSGIFTRHRQSKDVSRGSVHSPIRAVKEKFGIASDSSEEGGDIPLNRDGEKASKNQLRKYEKQAEKEKKAEIAYQREKEAAEKVKRIEAEADQVETELQKSKYGELPVNNYSGGATHYDRIKINQIDQSFLGKEVVFRARVHAVRKLSSKLVFFLFRQETRTIQGVLNEHGPVSKYFMFWAHKLDLESVVLVKGIVQEPKTKQGEVTGASIHEWEISVHELHVEGKIASHLPYSVYEGELANKVEEEALEEAGSRHEISLRVRMANRIIDLRTGAGLSIFRLQSGLCYFFRDYLDSQGFIEIHTPKLQGGATESGASVFKVNYFDRPAFLAQSPQLAKQQAISADFGRVYEIGAVFRAENSNTHRHLTEYTGLDLEMAIDEHYHEVLRVLDNTFKHIFKGVYERYRHEIDTVKKHFPHEDLVWLEETPIIPFAEGVKLLNDSGWRDEHGNELPLDEDLGTRDEIQLGRVIKEKYKTDYYILDKFPVTARPFYAMPDPTNPKVTNSFDIFLRGQEILSGGQRIHDAAMLIKQLETQGIDVRSMEEYIQGFEYGAPPHGGGGIGLERMLMLLLALGDIRNASLFHRDPKSFPARPAYVQLRHPESSTMHPPWEGRDRVLAQIDYQPLENLIANYGDASNTSWLEPRTKIWRDPMTGAAVGYVPVDGFAITVGDPLCHTSQYTKTIAGYLRFIKKELNLKPLWLLVGKEVETVMADRFNWRTFSVTAEQRVNPTTAVANHDGDVQRKIRHAEKEGVKVLDIPMGKDVPQEIRDKVDQRVKDWLSNRKGKQVHLTNIHPWKDMEHRSYHIATDKDGQVCALVIMAQLSPEHGWQVKYSMDFPGAPSGSIEFVITHTLKKLAGDGVTNCTFGGGATSTFTPGHNMKGPKVRMLSKAYGAIVSELKLTNKSEFREKLGATEDPIYICYPPHGMGPLAVRAILSFFGDDEQ